MRVSGRKCAFIMRAVAVWGCWQKLAGGPCPHTLAHALAQSAFADLAVAHLAFAHLALAHLALGP